MLSLTLDTSTEEVILVLSQGKDCLAVKIFPHQNNLSSFLLPSIETLLQENHKDCKNISEIRVGIGPGSYTGTRVGVIVAECLSMALNIPLYPFNSLLSFIPPTLPTGPFSCIWHAKHGLHFLLQGILEKEGLISSLAHRTLPNEHLQDPFIKENPFVLFSSPENKKNIYHPPNSSALDPELNIPRLLFYLDKQRLLPPEKPQIIYLHNL